MSNKRDFFIKVMGSILCSLVVVTLAYILETSTYALSALTFACIGLSIVTSWLFITVYNKKVLHKDQEFTRLRKEQNFQNSEIKKLKKEIWELQELNGINKEPYPPRDK